MSDANYCPDAGPEDIVFLDGDYAILKQSAIFLSGFNCYKATTPGGDHFAKLNPALHCFTTEDAARNWLSNYRAENDKS